MRRGLLQQKLTIQEEHQLKEILATTPLEKNDFLAMVIAGIIVILPVVLTVLGGMTLLIFALFIW